MNFLSLKNIIGRLYLERTRIVAPEDSLALRSADAYVINLCDHYNEAVLNQTLHFLIKAAISLFTEPQTNTQNRFDLLTAAVESLGDVKAQYIKPIVSAALAYETPQIPAELILSIAWGESRMIPSTRTGRVCGVMQVNPIDIGRRNHAFHCRQWSHSAALGVKAGVEELSMMLKDIRVKGNLRKALLYRACGNNAFTGRCRKQQWPGWVLQRAKKIHFYAKI